MHWRPCAVFSTVGLSREEIVKGFRSFSGVKRRMEVRADRGVVVVDDFGHHPTAVALPLAAARKRWPAGAFGPSLSRAPPPVAVIILRSRYIEALGAVLLSWAIMPVETRLKRVSAFQPRRLRRPSTPTGYSRGGRWHCSDCGLLDGASSRPGDVVILFSNGDFGGLHSKLLEELKAS